MRPVRKRRPVSTLVRVLRTLLLTYLLAVVALFVFQGALVWHPSPPPRRTPAAAGLAYEALTLTTSDGVTLEAWRIDAPSPRGAVLYCHGNSGSIAAQIGIAREVRALGWTLLVFDYRGFGNSGGEPSEEGTYRDAEAAYDSLRASGYSPTRIVLWGHSLGGAVAIELSRRRPIAALLTESTFTSVPDLGAERFPFLPVRLLARIHYDNLAKAAAVTVPWLLVHGRDDTIVDHHHAETLFATAQAGRRAAATSAPLLFHSVPRGHVGVRLGEDPKDTSVVREFLDAAVPG